MSETASPFVRAALAHLVGDDPLAGELVAAAARAHPMSFAIQAALAVVGGPDVEAVERARVLATARSERQHLAVIEAWLRGDAGHARLLAREHLAEYPDDIVVSWLIAKG